MNQPSNARRHVVALLAGVGLVAAVVGQYGDRVTVIKHVPGAPTAAASLPLHEPTAGQLPFITGW